jgi:hypothetical protein
MASPPAQADLSKRAPVNKAQGSQSGSLQRWRSNKASGEIPSKPDEHWLVDILFEEIFLKQTTVHQT